MASARKKQDEKHLKILRELVSIAGNKQCFDCHQRGPTYVNMTIGSFVCTSCSGMLRGLTPPHRVKSISMASFTPEEIEMIKSRGNEYCKRIWLGLYEASHQQESKDEQQIKDFMVAKYEKKRYYLDPSQAGILNKNGPSSTPTPVSPAPSQSSPRMTSSSHEIKPLSSLLGPGVRSIVLGHHQASSSTDNIHSASTTSTSSAVPWLRDFGSKDPFSSSTPSLAASSNTSAPQQPSFANFDNNPIFSSQTFQSAKSESVHPRYNTNRWSMPTPAALTSMGSTMSSFAGTLLSASSSVGAPPDEDRYAALKDLDSLMKSSGGAGGGSMSSVENGSSVQPDWPMASSSSPWTPQPTGLYGGGVFGSPPASVGVTAPPQQHLYHGSPSSLMEGHSNGSASMFSPPFSSPANSNPFAENSAVGGQGNWAAGTPVMGVLTNGTHPGASSGAYHSSQSQSIGNIASPFMPAYSTAKPQWSPVGNPFLVGPRPPSASAHSSNPFL